MFSKAGILCVFLAFFVQIQCQGERFHVIYEWNYINYTWPSEEVLKEAMSTGKYIPENNLISGIKYFEKYIYLTVPRFKDGVPATLTRITAESHEFDTEPLLTPYPSWEMNAEEDCNALQNVQNIEIDQAGLVWILDIGRTRTMTKSPINKCKPRLLIYDSKSNKTVVNYYFPDNVTSSGTYLYDLVIDETDGTYAYITDNSVTDPGIIVYSKNLNRAWKLRDEATMKASQDAVEFRVNGTSFYTPVNIAGIALSPKTSKHGEHNIVSKDRNLYYAPLSSFRLYSINTAVLKDERYLLSSNLIKDLGRKSSQSDGMVMDENGILYLGLLADNSIAKWDSKTQFTTGQKVIARDPIYIQWPISVAFDMSGNMLVVTNRFQKFLYGRMNLSEPNYRILEGYVGSKSYLYGVPKETETGTETESSLINKQHITSSTEESQHPSQYNTTHSEETEDIDRFELNDASYLQTSLLLLLVTSFFLNII